MKTLIVILTALVLVLATSAASAASPSCDRTRGAELTKELDTLVAARRLDVAHVKELETNAANVRAEIAHEKSNPAGVVDLALLHELGEELQGIEGEIQTTKASIRDEETAIRKDTTELRGIVAACKAKR